MKQGADYVNGMCNRLADVLDQTEFAPDTPQAILDTLRRARLVAVTEEDYEAMVNAYVMQEAR